GGHGSAMAQRFRQRRCRGVGGEHCAWAAAGEERNGAARGRALARPAGGRPDELDDCPPARRNRSARRRAHQPLAIVQGLAKKKFRWRRPRHTLKGRQTESEVQRVGLRLQLRKRQAEAGDIVLLYGDESEALTHPYLARAWAKSGADLRVPAPGQAKKVAMLGSLDHVTRQLIVHTSPTKRSSDFIDGADLHDANLNGADLFRAHLRNANLHDATLNGANLNGADLRNADLHGAYLFGANLNSADLNGAYLDGEQQLDGACGAGAKLPPLPPGLTLKPCPPDKQ